MNNSTKDWTARDYIKGALSSTHAISERTVENSVPAKHRKEVPEELEALEAQEVIFTDGPKSRRTYTLRKSA